MNSKHPNRIALSIEELVGDAGTIEKAIRSLTPKSCSALQAAVEEEPKLELLRRALDLVKTQTEASFPVSLLTDAVAKGVAQQIRHDREERSESAQMAGWSPKGENPRVKNDEKTEVEAMPEHTGKGIWIGGRVIPKISNLEE